jgi:hypothetical protein
MVWWRVDINSIRHIYYMQGSEETGVSAICPAAGGHMHLLGAYMVNIVLFITYLILLAETPVCSVYTLEALVIHTLATRGMSPFIPRLPA